MLLRPRIDLDDLFQKLRILDEYKYIDLINGIIENNMFEFDYKNINALYHFTPIINLPSILNHGLLSRDQCEDIRNIIAYNIFGLCTDTKRLDGRRNYISCSINKPYYNMLSTKRKYLKKFGGIAILKIDKSIINDANWRLFVNGNAAKKENSIKKDEELSAPNNILDENNLYKLDTEILIKDHIPLKYIESVNFSSCDFSLYNLSIFAFFLKFYYGNWFLNFKINDVLFGKNYNE